MAAIWNVLLVILTIFGGCCSCNSSPVPLLLWSSKSLDIDDDILAGHTLTYGDVERRYLSRLTTQPNTICLFVQDTLSIDDFAAYESSHFKNLKQVLSSSATSIVLPSVKSESNVDQKGNGFLGYFEKKVKGKIVSVDANDISDFPNKIKKLNQDELNIIVVYLPKSLSGQAGGERSLVASDNVIGKISEELAKRVPEFVGLLTANMPRDDVILGMQQNRQVSTSHVRSRREAVDLGYSTCTVPGILVTGGTKMLYLSDISFNDKNHSDHFKSNQSILNYPMDESTNNTIKFTFPSGSFINGSDITLSVVFNQTGNGNLWSCYSIKMSGKLAKNDVEATFDCSSEIKQIGARMEIPFGKSYACNNYKVFGTKNVTLIMRGFQVQLNGRTNGTFLNSVNCVGFFTAPIWMGLITVGVLVAILYGGVLGLLSIKCMDRFDNPNDPTITIHAD